jgi:hypothetical protein
MKMPEDYIVGSIKVDTEPVDPASHTMRGGSLAKYVSTKFSPEQFRLLNDALQQGVEISVHGFYDQWMATFCTHYNLTRNAAPLVRDRNFRYGRRKEYNTLRPIVLDVTRSDGNREVVIFVFPSHEYVQQYAEIVATYALIAEHAMTIPTYHYPDLEAEITQWTGLDAALQELDAEPSVVIMGEIALVRHGLIDLDFSNEVLRRDLGLHDMFSIHELRDDKRLRRVYLFGAKHSYWGSASGYIAMALARAGAKHIIYAAKAGNFISVQKIHEIFCPSHYWLLSENPRNPGHTSLTTYSLPSPISDVRGFLGDQIRTGIHLTVPTVVGETQAQRSLYESAGPTTIDNEISFIARELAHFNAKNARQVQFTALHFITDYLYEADEHPTVSIDLSVLTKEYDDKKRRSFREISRIIDTYASLVTTTQFSRDGDHWAYSILDVADKWSRCKEVMRTIAVEDLTPRALFNFLLKARYASYYYGETAWALSLIHQLCEKTRHRWELSQTIDEVFAILGRYYELRTKQDSNRMVQARELKSVAQNAHKAAINPQYPPYARYVMAVTQIQALLQVDNTRREGTKGEGMLRGLCSLAKERLLKAELSDQDLLFEQVHLTRLQAFVETIAQQPEEAKAYHLVALNLWDEVFVQSPEDIQWTIGGEIALTKLDLIKLGYQPDGDHWYEDLHRAPRELAVRFALFARLQRELQSCALQIPQSRG